MTEYEVTGEDDERIVEWEMGLPNGEDLTPLYQSLIPPELASAFSISPIPYRTVVDVNRASQSTLATIKGSQAQALSWMNSDGVKSFAAAEEREDPMETAEEEEEEENAAGSETTKVNRTRKQPECAEEADSSAALAMTTRTATTAAENSNDDPSSAAARTLKRPRLVWTPQLHKRFVDVVAHLGIKNAVPKTIMQLMNVEGLTRENVASHLQKYRLYLKRMQGLSNDDLSPSDHLFASTPVPPQCYENGGGGGNNNNNNNNNSNANSGHVGVSIPPPPPQQQQHHQPMMMPMPMPVYGMMNQGFHPGHGFDQNMYNMNMGMAMGMNMGMNNMMQQKDWSVNKHYAHHVTPSSNDK